MKFKPGDRVKLICVPLYPHASTGTVVDNKSDACRTGPFVAVFWDGQSGLGLYSHSDDLVLLEEPVPKAFEFPTLPDGFTYSPVQSWSWCKDKPAAAVVSIVFTASDHTTYSEEIRLVGDSSMFERVIHRTVLNLFRKAWGDKIERSQAGKR